MPVANPQTARKKLFYNGIDGRKHRIFLYLFFSEDHRNFRVLRVDRAGDDIVETDTDVPEFLDSATLEERLAFTELISMLASL
jgi:hypothetical protein